MTSPLVLVPTAPQPLELEALERLRLLRLWEEPDPAAALARNGADVVAVANPGGGPLGTELLDELPNLEIVAHFGVGYETVDVAAAVSRGIVVTNVSGSNDAEVADTAMGLLLMAVRELGPAERYVRRGRWTREGAYPLAELSLHGGTLGVLGIGGIGRAIARRARAFELDVAYHARNRREDVDLPYHATVVELARAVDFLVVAVPGGSATHHLVDAEVLEALGPRGVLVNIARGSVVDEDALIAALRSGGIAAAGLDVYQDEPNVPAELLELDNAVLLPHIGSATVPTRREMAEAGVANLTSWFADGVPLTPVPEARELVDR
jgi:lactate dehydrogenase-like 2-hydroxyacid dehydrogenase